MNSILPPTNLNKAIIAEQQRLLSEVKLPGAGDMQLGNPFTDKVLELRTDFVALTSVVAVPLSGFQLLFRRDGSVPGARLDVSIGGKFSTLYPGSRLVSPFTGFQLQRSPLSARSGQVTLTVIKAGHDFLEPAQASPIAFPPAWLLGDFLTGSTQARTVGTNPDFNSGSPFAGTSEWFYPVGFNKVRLRFNGTGLGDVRVTPFYWLRDNADDYNNSEEEFSMTDEAKTSPQLTSGTDLRRVLDFNINSCLQPAVNPARWGDVKMGFRFDVTGAATSISGQQVEGIG